MTHPQTPRDELEQALQVAAQYTVHMSSEDAAIVETANRAALATPPTDSALIGEPYCYVMHDRNDKRVGWSGTVWGGLHENEMHLLEVADQESPENGPHFWAALYRNAAITAGREALAGVRGEQVSLKAVLRAADEWQSALDDCTLRAYLEREFATHPKASEPAQEPGIVADLKRTVQALQREEDGGWSPDAHSHLLRLATSINMLTEKAHLPGACCKQGVCEQSKVGINGLTEAETSASMSVRGLSKASEPAPSIESQLRQFGQQQHARLVEKFGEPAPSTAGESLITVESSLRFRLECEQQKSADLLDEVRELKGRLEKVAAQPAQGERAEAASSLRDAWLYYTANEGANGGALGRAIDRAATLLQSPADTKALAEMEARKDAAYLERNQLVALLSKLFPSGTKRTAIEGWSEDWHGCVYIDLPTGQASWHYHDSQAHLFAHLPAYSGEWDGHTTEQKYERITAMDATGNAGAVGELTDEQIVSAWTDNSNVSDYFNGYTLKEHVLRAARAILAAAKAQPERVGMTDADIDALQKKHLVLGINFDTRMAGLAGVHEFARAIEAAHGITGGQQ